MSLIVQKLYSIKTNNFSYLSVPNYGWLNWWNNECEWWSMNVSALKIWNESNLTEIVLSWKKHLILPLCSWVCLSESKKQWMWGMNYECESITNMEWVKSYESCIQSKQSTDITLLFSTMFNWIDKKMDVSDEIWMSVYQKYGISQIVQTFIQSKPKKSHTLMLLMIFYWIN